MLNGCPDMPITVYKCCLFSVVFLAICVKDLSASFVDILPVLLNKHHFKAIWTWSILHEEHTY